MYIKLCIYFQFFVSSCALVRSSKTFILNSYIGGTKIIIVKCLWRFFCRSPTTISDRFKKFNTVNTILAQSKLLSEKLKKL